jgi:hypothetical protein
LTERSALLQFDRLNATIAALLGRTTGRPHQIEESRQRHLFEEIERLGTRAPSPGEPSECAGMKVD